MPLAPAPPVDMDDEPPNKKNRTEDNLIPENVFLQCHKVRNYFKMLLKIKLFNYFSFSESNNNSSTSSTCE